MAAPFIKQKLESSSSDQEYFLELPKLLEMDNMLICLSQTLTYFRDLDKLQSEPVSFPFSERFKITTLRKSYL